MHHGTFPYAALEQLLGFVPGPAADMYAFGVILWEICTGEAPLRGCLRLPHAPEECPQEIVDLMYRCWDSEPTARPRAAEAAQLIKSVLY